MEGNPLSKFGAAHGFWNPDLEISFNGLQLIASCRRCQYPVSPSVGRRVMILWWQRELQPGGHSAETQLTNSERTPYCK